MRYMQRKSNNTIRRGAGFDLIELPFDKLPSGLSLRVEDRVVRKRKSRAFTLIELLVVISVISLLVSILLPSLYRVRTLARRSLCASNARSMNMALILYMEMNRGQFFPFLEQKDDGKLWYWGFEKGNEPEGSRPIDTTRARLAPYISPDGQTMICPSLPSDYPHFKPKFLLPGYGYALNRMMLSGLPQAGNSWAEVLRPSETITWADSVQINTWTPPASSSRPMIEEWYYLDNRNASPATFHFRHLKKCNVAFADGSARSLQPYWLDNRCDGLVGRLEPAVAPSGVSDLLRLKK